MEVHYNGSISSRAIIIITCTVYTEPSPQEGLVISGPSIDDVIMFGAGSVSPFIDVPFPIQDDAVPGEPLEVYNLTLSEPSDPRVMIGGSFEDISVVLFAQTEVNIADDDATEISELSAISIAYRNIILFVVIQQLCLPHSLQLSLSQRRPHHQFSATTQ